MSVLRISAPSIEHQVSAMLSILVRYPSLSLNFISLLGRYLYIMYLTVFSAVLWVHITLMRIHMRIHWFLFDMDPDVNLDPDFYLMSMRIRIRLFTLMLLFHTFWLVICKLMRIRIHFRIQLVTLKRISILIFIDTDPDPIFSLIRIRIRIRIQDTKMMRIVSQYSINPDEELNLLIYTCNH